MSDPNSNPDQPGLMARLGNWLKKDQPGGAPEPRIASVRPKGPSTRADLDVLERQVRKARLGLVRKSEFEELRRSIGHSPIPKGSTFSLTSALVPNTSFLTRARQNTRLKIDSIEEQISRSWFNSGLHKGSAITGLATLPGTSSRPYKPTNQTEMKVELDGAIVTLELTPEVLNAATAYALGDFVTAEQVLIALTKKHTSLASAQLSWDLLFEFYLALGRQSEFENLSVDFAGRFGKSPPIWTDHWNLGLASAGLTGQQGNGVAVDQPVDSSPAPEPFVVASYLVADDVAALTAGLDLLAEGGLLQVDWRKLMEIDVDALPGLVAFYEGLLSRSCRVHYWGASQLTDTLHRQTKIANQDLKVQRQLWHLLFMHLQLIDDPTQLEEVSLRYSVLFEEIIPANVTVSCNYVPELDDKQATPEGDGTTSEQVAEPSTTGTLAAQETGFRILTPGVRVVAITGTLKGDISDALGVLPLPVEGEPLVFDCKGFARIDSQAVGHFLGFLRSNKCSTGAVKLRGLNRLIGVYLFSFGLPQNVTISFVTL